MGDDRLLLWLKHRSLSVSEAAKENAHGENSRKKQIVLMLLAAVLVSMCAGVVMAKRLPAQGESMSSLKSLPKRCRM